MRSSYGSSDVCSSDRRHLITFFTVGPQEARAWTVHTGANAPEAAGEIHSDLQKGFIRAETIAYDDYVALGGEARAREAGKLRAEGKDRKSTRLNSSH